MVRDCRRLNADLTNLLVRGDIGMVARPLIDLGVAAALATNALELIPRRRYISDALVRELETRLAELDVAVAETMLLPA